MRVFEPLCGGLEFNMKLKRFISVTLLLCMLFSLASCKSGANAAKEVVNDFMTALTTYDLNAMAGCVEDIPDNSGSSYIHDIYTEDYYRDLYATANEKLTYSITSANAKEVKLKVQMPDLYTLYNDTLLSVLSATMENEDFYNYVLDEENDPPVLIVATMINSIKTNGINTVEEEITLSIGKINGEYKILTDDSLKMLMTSKLSLTQKEALSITDNADSAQ